MLLDHLHDLIWISWLVYWKLLSANVKTTVRRDTPLQLFIYTVPLILAVLLFYYSHDLPPLDRIVVPDHWAMYIAGTIVLVLGLLFAIWARHVLGRNWSGRVTVKENHELIQTGPYRWVRHPIYTGILVGFVGSAMALDEWVGFVIIGLVFFGFWIKLRREEAWMTEVFGEQYRSYRSHTAALIPFLI